MGRPKAGDRVLGPYRESKNGKDCWRVLLFLDGRRTVRTFEVERVAERFAAGARGALQETVERTVEQALEAWEKSLRDREEPPPPKQQSMYVVMRQLRAFFAPALNRPLTWLCQATKTQDPDGPRTQAATLYEALRKRPSKAGWARGVPRHKQKGAHP